MKLKCALGLHNWLGCKCSQCGKTRDHGHNWQACKCSQCYKTRDQGHDWSKDCERCANCYKSRTGSHDWSKDCEKCTRCGTKAIWGAHDWKGRKVREMQEGAARAR